MRSLRHHRKRDICRDPPRLSGQIPRLGLQPPADDGGALVAIGRPPALLPMPTAIKDLIWIKPSGLPEQIVALVLSNCHGIKRVTRAGS
jgi:hypothetical protein